MGKPWLEHYDPGVPEAIAYPAITIEQALAASAAKAPGAVMMVFRGLRLTYGEVDGLVDRLAAALQQLGVRPGDRVALHLPNCPQYVVAYHAILRAGAIAVPCNPSYVAREMAYQLDDCGAQAIVSTPSLAGVIRQIRSHTLLRSVILTDPRDDALLRQDADSCCRPGLSVGEGEIWLGDLLSHAPSKPSAVRADLHDPAVLMYTGGTTGVSKGAQLSHRNLVANAAQCAHWLRTQEKGAVILTALPLFHSYAMTMCMNHAVYVGGRLVLILDPRDLGEVLDSIQSERPTIYPGVPASYVALNNSPQVTAGSYDLGSIEACISGGAGLPVEVQVLFQELTGGRLVEGYGLSEASPVTHINPVYGDNRIGSIGVPVPDTLARIVDLDTGTRELRPGEAGELCVSGPQVMRGYWGRPDETADALRAGWLYTGDIATMDEDGYFRIVDRKKDMIVGPGGLKVYPREIEDVLYGHPKVREAAAAGVSMGEKGERVKVWIVLKDGQTASEEEILAFCAENLAPFKRPKAVEFRDSLPKSAVGKILRRVLVEQGSGEA